MKKFFKVTVLIFVIIFIFIMFFNPFGENKYNIKPIAPPKHGGIYVVAHRGAHNSAPENSLAAYQKAIDLGVDYIEVDIRTTKDGVIVSCHNETIDAYTDGRSGKVNDFTFKELQTIDIGIKKGIEWKDTRIPTLEEILKIAKGKCGIYLDLKETPIKKLVTLLKKYDMQHKTLWYSPSFRFWTFNAIEKECPDGVAMPDPIYNWLLPWTLDKMKPQVIASSFQTLNENFVKKCQNAGALVIIDEDKSKPEEWQKSIQWGVNGIQTDQPEKLIQFLEKNN